MAALTADEKKRLHVVLVIAENDEHKIRNGIIAALRDVNERGTRNYLWHLLQKKAQGKIRRAKRDAYEKFSLT